MGGKSTNNDKISDVNGWAIHFNYQSYQIVSVTIFPNYLDSSSNGSSDLALIELDDTVTNIQIPKLCTNYNELHNKVIGVGYGASGDGSKAETVNEWFEKTGGENIIDSLGGVFHNNKPSLLIFDFDCPDKNLKRDNIGSPLPLPLEYGVTGGDSGGGLFRRDNKTWELVGILSQGSSPANKLLTNGYCGEIVSWTRVSVYNDWILNTIKMKEAERKAEENSKKK